MAQVAPISYWIRLIISTLTPTSQVSLPVPRAVTAAIQTF
jgi:hypothetical protein